MTTTPPIPGLTREQTPWPHDVYRGFYITPELMADIERRAATRQTAAATDEFPERPVRAVPTGAVTTPVRDADWRRRTGQAPAPPGPKPQREPRLCRECETEFVPTTSHNVYCKPACARRAASRRRPAQQPKYRRGTVTAKCLVCDREFQAVNRGAQTRRTCSEDCRGLLIARTASERRAA